MPIDPYTLASGDVWGEEDHTPLGSWTPRRGRSLTARRVRLARRRAEMDPSWRERSAAERRFILDLDERAEP